MLKQVLKLPWFSSWSLESRSCLPSGVVKLSCEISQKAPPPKLQMSELYVSQLQIKQQLSLSIYKKGCFVPPGITACHLLCSQDAGRKKVLVAKLAAIVQQHSQLDRFLSPSHSVIALIYLAAMQLSPVDNCSFVIRRQRFC